ncbi:hypothetical protein J6590_063857 [Homalodisca vitripennis]|nr:hypothetical protein J6590_063857 [Homalodisca vitripennis]
MHWVHHPLSDSRISFNEIWQRIVILTLKYLSCTRDEGVRSRLSGQWTAKQTDRGGDGTGGDDDDTQEAARRDTNGPGLDNDAGQPRSWICIRLVGGREETRVNARPSTRIVRMVGRVELDI